MKEGGCQKSSRSIGAFDVIDDPAEGPVYCVASYQSGIIYLENVHYIDVIIWMSKFSPAWTMVDAGVDGIILVDFCGREAPVQ